jgi:hypothetical protein
MNKRRFFLPLLIYITYITIIAIVIAFPAANARAEVVKGLVLYLPFEEAGNPLDLSPNPTKVSIKGSLKSVDGKIGKALEYNGKSANLVEVQHADKLEGMKALTIAAWAKPIKPMAQEGMSIASKRIAFDNADVYNLFLWTGQTMRARVNAKGEIASKTAFEDGKWYHVVYTFDGAEDAGKRAKLYINGKLETVGNHPDQAVVKSGASLWVGELDPNRGFAWNGVLDEVGIWDRALSEAELKSVMEDGLAKLLSVEPQGKLTTSWGEVKKKIGKVDK